MEIIQIAEKIQDKIKLLEKARLILRKRAESKAEAVALYEKNLAKIIIQLKNSVAFTVDSQTIVNPPASVLEKIARGICFDEKLKLETAEALYKSIIVNIEAIKAELNGYQSIFRYLDEK